MPRDDNKAMDERDRDKHEAQFESYYIRFSKSNKILHVKRDHGYWYHTIIYYYC